MKRIIFCFILIFILTNISYAETVRVVYKTDKSIAIIHYVESSLSREAAFDKAIKHGEYKGLPYDDIDSSELPQSRENRNYWEGEKGKKITINQEQAQVSKDEKERKAKIEVEMKRIAEQSLIDSGELDNRRGK